MYIKKIKKLYGPNPLHLEPSNVLSEVEPLELLAKGEEPFCLPSLVRVYKIDKGLVALDLSPLAISALYIPA